MTACQLRCQFNSGAFWAQGFSLDESTSLEGYVFAQLTGASNASIVVDLIDERVRGTCGDDGAGCPVLASQTIALQPASSSPSWQKLNLSLTVINGSTTCTNGSVRRTIIGLWVAFFQACHQSSCEQGVGPSFVRCVGRFGGGPPAYFLPPNHPYEEGVCITCTGKLPRYRWLWVAFFSNPNRRGQGRCACGPFSLAAPAC